MRMRSYLLLLMADKEAKTATNATSYQLQIVVSFIITVILVIIFIGAGVTGLNVNASFYLFYFQIVATFIALLLTISETFLVIYIVAKLAHDDDIKADHSKEGKGKNEEYQYPQTKLYDFGDAKISKYLLFFGLLCLNACLLSMFWVFTSVISYPSFGIRSYHHFRSVDIIIGYIAPVLLMMGLILVLKVAQIITKYYFNPESIFASILVFVDYNKFNVNPDEPKIYTEETADGQGEVHTSGFGAWSIGGYFHYPIIEVPDDLTEVKELYKRQHHCIWSDNFDKLNIPSWCLGLILTLNVILCLRVLTEATLIKRLQGAHLSCDEVDDNFDCFFYHSNSYIYVNCSNSSSFMGNLECLRYYSPREVDPLGALIRAIFLFITYEKFLQLLFTVVKALYQIRYSKAWGIAILVTGILMIIFSILFIVCFDWLETGLHYLSVLQFTVLSLNVFLVGVLLVINKRFYESSKGNLKHYSQRTCSTD